MGLKFGRLAKMTGVTFFRLSPYEQKAFAGVWAGGGRMMKRWRTFFLRFGFMFGGTYMLMVWANEENRKMHRKNPKDFENDV
ncbi:ubiquinol-cytochrome c reductase ubiquinone-binding protein [Xylocopa sonorina]|uniref:ubiquinol-cytochrome c reductase ubiquinone-binding protein n=1 Tax=Xylocopa sonorina TaxID=1818115 RepID=UPI00403A8A21